MYRVTFSGMIASVVAFSNDTDFYSEPPATMKGCTCKGPCQVSLNFDCWSQYFCSVESKDCPGGEAEHSLTHGYYDYCTFPTYKPWEDRTAAEKHRLLMDAVYADKTMAEYPDFPAHMLYGFTTASMWNSFEGSDILPVPRKKWIHTAGFTAPVRFESNGLHNYTGLFKGAEYGIIRFSSSTRPGLEDTYTPSFGLKLLRDGVQSANLVTMPQLDGTKCTETNFFSFDFNTKLVRPESWLANWIGRKFMQATHCPLHCGVSVFATEEENGESVAPNFPYWLKFRSTSGLNVTYPCDMDVLKDYDFGSELTPGTVLFDALAIPEPDAEPFKIGQLVLTGRITRSKFGDEQLLIKHQKKETDFALRPDWIENWSTHKKDTECGFPTASTVPPTAKDGCTVPFTLHDDGPDGMLEADVTV